MTKDQEPKGLMALGYAGLIPQAAAVFLALTEAELGFIALAGGFAYAALIFSFLGGIWWGQSLQANDAPKWALAIAVLPSLIALALFLPWTVGWEWPAPALAYLAPLIALSPLVDRALGLASPQFMRMRWHLSIGLGALTMALAVIAYVKV